MLQQLMYTTPTSTTSKTTQETTPRTPSPIATTSSEPVQGTLTDSSSPTLSTSSVPTQGPGPTLQTSPSFLSQSQSSFSIGLPPGYTSEGAPTQTISLASNNQVTPSILAAPPVSGTNVPPNSTSQLPGGQTSAGDISNSQQPHKQSTGVIVGATVAGVILLGSILLLLVWRRHQKRHIAAESPGIEPFGNNEPAHGAVISALKHGEPDEPPVYPYAAVSQFGHHSTEAVSSVPRSTSQTAYDDFRANDASEKRPGALPPPPAAAAVSPTQHTSNSMYPQDVTIIGHDTPTGSPRTGTTERRRAVDGGLRIAGGLPGEEERFSDDDIFSVTSTLPPSYEVYRRHQAYHRVGNGFGAVSPPAPGGNAIYARY
ncbi:hypothetical protein C2E23DRAFT_860464 [Lenzites betulinus]|nr:hypothetical protein C2E23DRAFT_860464 [Lenzites betulinus]